METGNGISDNAVGERRNYSRVFYSSGKRAVFETGQNRFEIGDISQGGFRLIPGENKQAFSQAIRGIIFFLFGDTLEIDGYVEWEEPDEIGVSLAHLLPADIIEKEHRFVIAHSD